MKKVLCLLTALAMLFGCIGINVSAAEYGEVLNNNVALVLGSNVAVAHNTLQTLNVAPAEVDGTVLVPASAVNVLFNGTAVYDAASGYIDLRFGVDKTAVMQVGSRNYTFNGRGYVLDVAPKAEGSEAMIPLRALVETVIGQVYFYDPSTKVIIVSGRGVIREAAADSAVLMTIASAIQSRSLPPISVPTSYQLDWSIPVEETVTGTVVNDNGPIQSSMSETPIGTKINLTAGMIKASYEPETNNPAVNAIDGSTSSVWATEGMQEFIIDLGQATSIACVGVRMMNYPDGRSIYYAIDVSADGNNYRAVFDGESASGGNVNEYHTVGVSARYVKVSPKGNTNENNDWASVAEIEVYSGTVSSAPAASSGASASTANAKSSSPTGTKLNATNATFTAEPEANNPGRNALDGNPSTYWAVENSNSMTIDLGSAQPISCVGVQMRNYMGESGDSRTVNYGVELSADGSSYNSIYSGASAAGGGVAEYINGAGASARYIKITLNGSSANGWASLAEVEVYTGTGATAGATATATAPVKTTTPYGTKLAFTNASFTAEPESNNPGRSSFDGNPATYWAVENSNSMTIDLGSVQPVSSVGVQMRNYMGESGDSRTVNYGVEVSADGASYKSVYSGASAAGGGVMEYITVGSDAKFVKISLNGSSANGWASLAEVEVYTGTVPTAGASAGAAGTYPNMSTVGGQFIIADPSTNNVLTIANDMQSLTTEPYSKDAKQIWTQGFNSSGTTVQSTAGNYLMDVFEGSTAVGGQIGVWESNDGNNQAWVFELDGNSYYVKNVMSGLYLSVSGSGIAQLDRGSATAWVVADKDAEIVEAGEPVVDPNVPVEITEPISGDLKISVYGTNDTLTAGTRGLSITRNNFLDTQTWTMEAAEEGVMIRNVATGKVIEVTGEATENAYKVGLWDGNGAAHQSWTLEKVGGFYYIKNVNSGLYISYDATGIRQKDFANATKWSIRPQK